MALIQFDLPYAEGMHWLRQVRHLPWPMLLESGRVEVRQSQAQTTVDEEVSLGARFDIVVAEAAAERVREIMTNAEKDYVGLRVGVKNGGCAGQEYTFAYAEQIEPLDEVVEDKGVTILIEPKAVLFLIGSEIDYETTKLASKFVFRNPNETDACGCGESVTIIPAAALDAD